MVNDALLPQGKRTVNRAETAAMRGIALHCVSGVKHRCGRAWAIPKILIESGRFKFSENMLQIRLDIWQKRTRGRNWVFNGLC